MEIGHNETEKLNTIILWGTAVATLTERMAVVEEKVRTMERAAAVIPLIKDETLQQTILLRDMKREIDEAREGREKIKISLKDINDKMALSAARWDGRRTMLVAISSIITLFIAWATNIGKFLKDWTG